MGAKRLITHYNVFKLIKFLTVVFAFPSSLWAQEETPRYQDLEVVVAPPGYSRTLSQKEISKIISSDIKPTRDQTLVVRKIADNTMNTLMQSPEFRGNAVVSGAESFQKKMQYNVTLSDEKKDGIKHDINFQYLAFQNVARITYKGFVNAKVDWDTLNTFVQFELVEKLTPTKDIVITQYQNKTETRQFINLRMPWPF